MRRTLSFYRPYIPSIILVIGFLFGQAMCELALPGYMSDIINKGIVGQDIDYIKEVGIIMIGVSALSVTCAITAGLLAARVAAFTTRDARKALFERVITFSAAELEQFSTASLITRSTNDVQMVQQATVMILRMACFAPIMGIGAVIKALNTSVSLSWTIGVALAVIACIMVMAFVLVLPKFRVLQTKLDKINLIIKEHLSGILVIRAFTTEEREEQRFDDANMDLTRINMFVNRAMSFMMPALMFVMNGVSILIIWAGAQMIEARKLMIGDILAYLQYGMHVIMSFLFITMIFIMIPRAAVSAGRIGEVMSVESSVKNCSNPEKPEQVEGIIEFNNVAFAYPDAEEKAVQNISFTAMPGQTTAIIGGTGSGKSTLVKLIPRFYDVTEGEILLDGLDIRKMTQHDLRDNIGFVPQKGVLFSGTIASNLRYGREDADAELMEDAIETAQAADFVHEKPSGIDEEISQGGTNVSGGQKQRLSIARAVIKNPKVYVFDDSFSALDFKTDKALRNALEEKVKGSTIIIVAQRISTIMHADQILVMDEGRLVGKGTHRQLMSECSVYKEIALSQLSEEELKGGDFDAE